jgi:beta-galactosidase
MQLRSTDERFLRLADQWWRMLLPRIAPFLYKAGGPILMVQVHALMLCSEPFSTANPLV